jgi:Dolichyl-phosphate-mannose-protein mannosyltransferase
MIRNISYQKLLVGLVLLLGFTALYTHTRTEVHTFDALSYTQDLESKPFGELYHPHHLLYGVVGRIAFDTAQTFGYDGRADQPIQFLNALAGAIGVILFWRFGGSFTGHRWLPLSVAVLMGMCYAYWLYATEVEVYTFAVGFMIAALYILTLLERQPKTLYVVLLAVAHTGAVMFHQTNILFALPLGLFLLVTPSLRRHILVYGFALGLAVGIPYVLVGWFSGFRDVDAYYRWLTDYAQTGTWGAYLSWDHREALKAGLLNTISLSHTLATLFYLLDAELVAFVRRILLVVGTLEY